jgi:hypothetical protein
MFADAGVADFVAGVHLIQASVVLFRAVLRDDVPAGYVVVSAYMGLEHNPLFALRPERYRTIINEAIVAILLDPEGNSGRCMDVGMAVLFDIGGFALAKAHKETLRSIMQEVV